ncbi:MAG: HAMP domain-containing histidine kinase [Bacteroidia bacterium]|nr:HAMP domain-containing histidine kinase [Bacteroidia bacterium]
MKKRNIIIILCFTLIALIGLIITQLFWIHNAVNLAGDQFDHRVTIAIKQALNDLVVYNKTTCDTVKKGISVCCPHSLPSEKKYIRTDILDSLLKIQFIYHMVDTIFEYAIVEFGNKSPLYKKKDVIRDKIPVTCHSAGLSCIWQSQNFYLEVYFPDKYKFIIKNMGFWLLISIGFIIIVILSSLFNVLTILKQKKLSDMKNDFINNMTHEFKTPISTISMATEVLLNTNVEADSPRIKKYAQIINEENLRLRSQVERVLEIAEMEKSDYMLELKEKYDIHELIEETVRNMCLDHYNKKPQIKFRLKAETHELYIDRLHFCNVISNLVDNACKYSGENPEIEIGSENAGDALIISVSDNGIGMKPEAQKHIFDKFYRVQAGNIQNTKGFGLGLFYVRKIIGLHGGVIKVTSDLNKGSRFDIILPVK